MAWAQLSATKPHIAYALLGGFITVFSLVSLFIKERLYVGEATVAMVVGIIFGPVAANIFNPYTWGNVDYITLEVARIVVVVQVFAVGVELPKKYLKRHWRGVAVMLLPVMTSSWFICAGFIRALIPKLNFVESLVIAATLAPTDPVLASSVVGKGKFAERVPGHIRNLLSCESGCNDGLAFPFLYLGLYIILDIEVGKTAKEWILITILYECTFGIIIGALIGYGARRAIRYAEGHKLIDRESFLVFYFVLALFCTGIGSVIGVDDFLVAFSAGAAFAWDGWFSRKTEESHVSNVIDLLLNMAFFVYFGAIIPWSQFNSPELSITPWRLIVLSILILIFRRIPGVFATYRINPDVRTWREALFCGHFGPMGVGALFFAILARAELETESQVPAGRLPGTGEEHGVLINAIYPIVTFVVLSSIIVHGSSIAVFTLGKHINTNVLPSMSVTFTRGRNSEDGSPSWLSRLPRLEIGQSMTFSKSRDRSRSRDRYGGPVDKNAIGIAAKPTAGRRRQKHENSQSWDENANSKSSTLRGSASSPVAEKESSSEDERTPGEIEAAKQYAQERDADDFPPNGPHGIEEGHEVYQEGNDYIIEDELGEVIKVVSNPQKLTKEAAHNYLDKDQATQHIPRKEREEIAANPSHPQHDRLRGFTAPLTNAQNIDPKKRQDVEKDGVSRENDIDRAPSYTEEGRGRNKQRKRGVRNSKAVSDDQEETAVEKRRRHAALGISKPEYPYDDDVVDPTSVETDSNSQIDDGETSVERRRRLQALGHSLEDRPSFGGQDTTGPSQHTTNESFRSSKVAEEERSKHTERPVTISFHASVDNPSTTRHPGDKQSAESVEETGRSKSLRVPSSSTPKSRSPSPSRNRSIVWADHNLKRD